MTTRGMLTKEFCCCVLAFADGARLKTPILWRNSGERRKSKDNFYNRHQSDHLYVGTVNKKYHVLLIRVKNDSDVPLSLDKD
jgi:hypothetical protein